MGGFADADVHLGSGCIAALECERLLAEEEEEAGAAPEEAVTSETKHPKANGVGPVPEYTSNPLVSNI